MGGATENYHHQNMKAPPMKEKEDDYDACLHAMLLCAGQVNAAVLNAAIELNLFDIIAQSSPDGGFVSPFEIASKLPTKNNAEAPHRLDRMLRLLVAHSLLTCSIRTTKDGSTERLYALSPTGEYFVSKEDGASWAALMPSFSYHPHMAEIFLNLKTAMLINGGNDLSKIIHGKSVYQYMETDPPMKQKFHRAMSDLSSLHMLNILQTYKGFEGIPTLVDVGGGMGQSLKMIISKYPSINGINFDLPHVVQDAPPYPEGIKHVGGDMFKSVPEGDAIMIKGTTHNWSDEKCIKLFSNCHEALKKGGKVIVIDLIMPEEPELSSAAKSVSIFDNVMFSQGGGMERTEKQFEALCKKSGFSGFQVACRALSILGVMEFYK